MLIFYFLSWKSKKHEIKFILHKYVIKKTNQSAKSLFPVILDVENPKFFTLLDICSEMNKKLFSEELKKDLGIVVFFKKLF